MYKHILIPIDGTKLGELALKNGIAFARSIRARVTGFTAVPPYQMPSESSIASRTAISITEHNKRSKKAAEKVLKKLSARARAAGVACETDYVQSDRPDEAIVRAAQKHGCDLIVMASHGRGAVGSFVFGSETRGVLAKSKIPTLVYR